jgi:hypothetical protein
MRKRILFIAGILVVPALVYLVATIFKAQAIHPVLMAYKALGATKETLFDAIWARIDKIGSTLSIFLGLAVAAKELHTTKKKKRAAKAKGEDNGR